MPEQNHCVVVLGILGRVDLCHRTHIYLTAQLCQRLELIIYRLI
jgi:hypothetical protein